MLTALFLAAALPAQPAGTSTVAAERPPTIELITMGPGGYLYSYWGHSALRVVDPRDGSDVAYNYGGIDWGEDDLARMMRGYVRAFMFVTPFPEVLAGYSGEDRTITRRPLALTPAVARALADRLKAASSAPRSEYAYHHFYDNCTTRIRDELDHALSGALARLGAERVAGTFRSRVLRPAREHVLLYALLDLSYSGVVDRPITAWDAAFLGGGLEALLERPGEDGARLAPDAHDVFRSIGFDETARWSWPWVLIYTLFVAPLCLFAAWRPELAARLYGLIAGALGLLFVALWTGSTYDFFRGNWNVLILTPLHLLLVVAGRSRRGLVELALGLHLLVLLGLACARGLGLLVQVIDPALGLAIPPTLCLVLSLRRTRPIAG